MSGRGGKTGNPQKSTARSKLWKSLNNKAKTPVPHGNNYVTRKDLHGGKITPATNPPDVTYQPWIHVTLVHSFSTSKYDCQVKDIIKLLRRQLDPESRGFNQTTSGDHRFVVQLRVHSIMAWNLTGRMLALTVDDFSEAQSAAGGRDQLCGIVDTGTQNHTPCVGYLLPSSHRQMVLRTDDKQGEDYIYTVTSGSSDQCVVYTKIAFRFDGPVRPPSLTMPIGQCINLLASTRRVVTDSHYSLRAIDEVLQRLKEISENTYASRPSTLKSIVKGVEMIALAVSAVGDEETSEFSDMAEELQQLNLGRCCPETASPQ